MEQGDKTRGGPSKKHDILWEKMSRVGERGGHTTPVATFWRTNHGGTGTEQVQQIRKFSDQASPFNYFTNVISSRKLAASLWELHHYNLPLDSLLRGGAPSPPPLRGLNHRHHHHRGKSYNDKGGLEDPDPSPGSPDLIEPYNSAVTVSRSVESKGRAGGATYSLKTSAELIKVLDHIWTLEKQHLSNMSLIKSMKKELVSARSQIKMLVREQKTNHCEMEELLKHIREEKLAVKTKEHDRFDAVIQSMRDELEDERKLRKQSESMQRKLARELCDVKTSLASISKELETERKSRALLEELCDEFGLGIRDYENDDYDRLILDLSQSWLDQRMEVKTPDGDGAGEKKNEMSLEIEAFFSKRNDINGSCQGTRGPTFRLNVAASAPRDEDDADGSATSEPNCFELEKDTGSIQKNHYEEKVKQTPGKDDGLPCSIWRSYSNPVCQQTENLPPQDPESSKLSPKLPPDLNKTIKTKPFEVGRRGQQSHYTLAPKRFNHLF